MKKAELKRFLQLYNQISPEIHGKQKETVRRHYGRRYVIIIPEWAWLLGDFIEEVVESEADTYFSKIMFDSYVKGKKDKMILAEYPISESTFYRWKRSFEEKVYQLYIFAGYVSKNEIIDNKILG